MIQFSVLNCRIKISFWFSAVCAFMLLMNKASQTALAAILIHESGHISMMLLTGQKPGTITFHAFGIDIGEYGIGNYGKDALISIAGPLINIISGAAAIKINGEFAALSLILGSFHCLPVFYLDGGRSLYSLMCMKLERNKAEKIMLIISVAVLLPVGIIAFCVLIYSKGNFSLLFLWIYLCGMLLLKDKRCF